VVKTKKRKNGCDPFIYFCLKPDSNNNKKRNDSQAENQTSKGLCRLAYKLFYNISLAPLERLQGN
jgi:hypothetical protein